jgi:glycosyltransferase involved in cell wall biosynthesis
MDFPHSCAPRSLPLRTQITPLHRLTMPFKRIYYYVMSLSTVAAGRPTFSIVVPIWNEEAVIPELYRRVSAIMDSTGEPWEMICVNDGSTDNSLEMLLSLSARDGRVRILDFSRNFGHQLAITAGSDFAEGDAVVIMDADLQDPPETILSMIEKWREGYEVVYAVRTEREGETKFKLWTASAFYRLLQRITDVNIPLDTGDFRLMDRRVVLAMRRLREQHRFMRGLSSWVGFKQVGVEYERSQRFAGETKYPLRKMLRLAVNAITSFSYVPLHLATFVGFALAGFSLLAIVVTVVMRLSGSSFFVGQATTLVSVLFLGGVQLIFLGIIGEYLGRIYDEAKDRPLYLVSHAYGFLEDAGPKSAGPAPVVQIVGYRPDGEAASTVRPSVPTQHESSSEELA